MRTYDLLKSIETVKVRGAWNVGVKTYALELLTYADIAEFASIDELKAACLNGAENWVQYSCGGCALIYDGDIAERLCSPSELKRVKHGGKQPNARETWLDVQARALWQAWAMIVREYKAIKRERREPLFRQASPEVMYFGA